MIDEHEPKMKVQLMCPKCHIPLIRVNEVKDNQMVDCTWMCINPICRKGLEFPIFYGYTQKDMDGQLGRYKQETVHLTSPLKLI